MTTNPGSHEATVGESGLPPAGDPRAAPGRIADQVNSLQHFQQHSRLHFIGQWKTRMHDEFQSWFAEHPTWNHGRLAEQSLFVHIDMDAFFCTVQLAKREHAHLRDKPVGIAAGRFNSDISSCNYVARGHGIYGGMYVNAARELCPELVILGYDLPACESVTKTLYRIIFEAFEAVTPPVKMSMEVYSIDEVMIASDTSDYDVLRGICERVRVALEEATGCTASCGIGPNIILARLATQKAKPNGIRVIPRENVPQVMSELPFREIHGAGRTTRQKVNMLLQQKKIISAPAREPKRARATIPWPAQQPRAVDDDNRGGSQGGAPESDDDNNSEDGANGGVVLCSHVQKLRCEDLQSALGKKAGETFYNLCRGLDSRVAMRTGDPEDQRALGKGLPSSVGCSMNYAVRPRSVDDVWRIAQQLIAEVCTKMKRIDVLASSLRVTLLERHPYHPEETQKFMGRGRCVEAHVPVKLPHPLAAESEDLMFAELKAKIAPLLVVSRDITDEERAVQLGFQNRPLDSQIIWTVTLASLKNVIIEDVRGMSVQATGLKAATPETETATELRKRDRERAEAGDGQMTLAAAFSRSTVRSNVALGSRGALGHRTRKFARGDGGLALCRVAAVISDTSSSSSDGDGGSLGTRGDLLDDDIAAQSPQTREPLYTLTLQPWGEVYRRSWFDQCQAACEGRDVPLVRAYLRAAALALASMSAEPGPWCDREMAHMVRFVEAKLGCAAPSFL